MKAFPFLGAAIRFPALVVCLPLWLIPPAQAANIAALGAAVIGVNDAIDSDAGTLHANSGAAANLIDDNLTTRVDTWFGGNPDGVSFVGVVWPTTRYDQIHSLTLTLATFSDGGWFGYNGVTPTPGQALDEAWDLVEPTVQTSTDGGATWTTVPHTSDYVTAMHGHPIGGGGQPNPTSQSVTFTLDSPASAINGIRILGENGGYAGTDENGFLGVFELIVEASPAPDTDNDGMGDPWEVAFGLTVGADDGNGDLDNDGLTNREEYQAGTRPDQPDSDGDGLNDAAEIKIHQTNPLVTDSDGDGLTDGEETGTTLTDPTLTDTDGDGLSDGDEVLTYETNPRTRDTDVDSFSDALEISQGTDPTDPVDYPSNVALKGTGILGVNDAIDSDAGTPRLHAGVASALVDGNPATRIDNWFGDSGTDNGQSFSFVGVLWPSALPTQIVSLSLTLATFTDGGWFGASGTGPGSGGSLSASLDLVEPTIQISTDGGATWTSVTHTSDYLAALEGHEIGGGANPNPTSVTATFTLSSPPTGITGIRIIGENGGQAGADDNGFIGVFELAVAAGVGTDSDGDHLGDAWETANGLNVGVNDALEDPDADGLRNIQEFAALTHPRLADTDDDGLNDGEELMTYNTNPTVADTDGDGLKDGDEVRVAFSDPLVADSDGDGLTDGDEVHLHGSNPNNPDSDGDGFQDRIEVALASDPKSASSVPANISSLGTAILGTQDALDSGSPQPLFNSGVGTSINDADPTTRVDTYNGAGASTVSYVGILWPNALTQPLLRLELTLAVFFDGGWFGPNNLGPGTGGTLNAAEYLEEPVLQVTVNGGDTWETVAHTSDYLTALEGHPLPDVDFGPPTTVTAVFTLTEPRAGIDGARLIGPEGGTASGGFLGVFELAAIQEVAARITVAIQQTGTDTTLRWNSTPGTTYRIEQSTDLRVWGTAQDSLPAAAAPATETAATLTGEDAPARFFRLVALP